MKHARTLVLLGAGAVLAMSTNVMAQTRTTGSGIRVSKEQPAVSKTSTTTTTTTVSPAPSTTIVGGDMNSLPPFSLSAYPALTASNLAAHLLSGDSLEIRMAQLAQTKATDQRVRDYATMLVNDHTAHLASTTKMLKDENVVGAPIANDIEGQRMQQMLTNLTNMSAGTAWDGAFVRFQVQHHQNEIDLLNANTGNVHGHEWHELLEDTVAALTKHRDAGKSTATSVGISLY